MIFVEFLVELCDNHLGVQLNDNILSSGNWGDPGYSSYNLSAAIYMKDDEIEMKTHILIIQ